LSRLSAALQFGIWSAVKLGNLERVKELLEVRGESVETRDVVRNGVCFPSCVRCVDDVVGFQEHGRTPLHWACRYDKVDIIEYLFSKDADINAVDNVREFQRCWCSVLELVSVQDGNTPLHYVAAFSNTPSIIITLLDKDVIYDALNHANETPADMARRCGKALHARMLDLYKPVPGRLQCNVCYSVRGLMRCELSAFRRTVGHG
jgi:hypothetical protein